MTVILNNFQGINRNIEACKLKAGDSSRVDIIAVSKAQPVMAIREAYAVGIRKFGENYLQEALNKQVLLADLAIEWHFIGPIQSNKTTLIAQHFTWVQSLDRLKIAQRLNDARPAQLAPLQVCIQVNISNELTKGGVLPSELTALTAEIVKLPHLQLRGLMAIPAPSKDTQQQNEQFKQVRACFNSLKAQGFKLDTLSMGMSDDYQAAIAQGATMVRIGTGIFGAR